MLEPTNDDIEQVLTSRKMPLSMLPNAMFHPIVKSAWDEWENNKYQNEMELCNREWCRKLSLVNRYLKLQLKRQIDPNYCKKSTYNYMKMCNSKYI